MAAMVAPLAPRRQPRRPPGGRKMDDDIEGGEIGAPMGRPLALLASLLLAVPSAHAAPAKRGAPPRNASTPRAKTGKAPPLAQAVASMKALMRDRQRRQYRHHWERAIAGLLSAARGKDAGPAYLEAARARYALYRWSADERDRDKALVNANRAAMRGLREAKELAAAIRREAGDDRAALAARPKPARRSGRTAIPVRSLERDPEPPHEEEEDSPPDPTLADALADLQARGEGAPPSPGDAPPQGVADVTEVRTWSSGGYSRVAIYLSRWATWQKIELPPDGAQPRRIAFDFRPARLAGKALSRAVAGAQIDRVRAAQHDAATVRVVLDLPGADGAQVFALDDPPRLVVDVGDHPAAPPAVAAAEPESAPAAPGGQDALGGAASGEGTSRTVRRVVIDAGHGGHDPGAIGRRGLQEKAVTLDIAKRVAKELEQAGLEVILTRKGDRFLPLEDRTAIANTAGADLFVSIHANANPRRSRSGIETYFLNVTDDRYASRLAARENGGEIEGEGEAASLQRRILADLNAVGSAGSSRHLAALIQRELTRSVRSRFGDVRDLGVKSALFYVLLGARMPAVLVETGFISNEGEEKRLASAPYREEVAKAVSRAIRTFAGGDDRVAAAR